MAEALVRQDGQKKALLPEGTKDVEPHTHTHKHTLCLDAIFSLWDDGITCKHILIYAKRKQGKRGFPTTEMRCGVLQMHTKKPRPAPFVCCVEAMVQLQGPAGNRDFHVPARFVIICKLKTMSRQLY